MFSDLDPQWSKPKIVPLRAFTEEDLRHFEECGTVTGETCLQLIAGYRDLLARTKALEAEEGVGL